MSSLLSVENLLLLLISRLVHILSSILESRQTALTHERVRWINRPSGGYQSMLSDRFGAAATCCCSLAQLQKTLHNGEKWFGCVVSAHVTIPKLKSQVFSIFVRGVLETMKGSPCHQHCERPHTDMLTGRGPEEGGPALQLIFTNKGRLLSPNYVKSVCR